MSILLTLLTIVAFTLLFLLALIVLILLTVLLVPIRYDLKLKYKESFLCSLSLSWLLKIVKFEVNYDKELSTGLKIFGIACSKNTRSPGEEDEPDEEDFEEEDNESYEKYFEIEDKNKYEEADKESLSAQEYEDGDSRKRFDKRTEENSIVKDIDEDGENIKKEKNFSEKKRKKKKQSFSGFIKNEYEKIKSKVKVLSEKKERLNKLFNNKSLRRGISKTWQAVLKLLKLFRTRELSGKIIFGFEDPYTTGQVLSYAALFYSWYKDRIEIIPVFDKEIVDIDIRAKGGVRLMSLVIIATGLWFDKDFKRLYKLYKNRDKIL
mgnify:CR=1 FL=1